MELPKGGIHNVCNWRIKSNHGDSKVQRGNTGFLGGRNAKNNQSQFETEWLKAFLLQVGQVPLNPWHVGCCSPAIAPFEAASGRRQDRVGLGGGDLTSMGHQYGIFTPTGSPSNWACPNKFEFPDCSLWPCRLPAFGQKK